MNKYLYLIFAVLFIGGISGCGDNKTKEKLIGTSVITSSGTGRGNVSQASTPQGSSASMTANSASMAAMAGGGSAKMRPAPSVPAAFAAAQHATSDLAGLEGPDSGGYFTYPGLTGTTMKIRFLQSDGVTAITAIQTGAMMQLAFVNVVITSAYSFGTFTGNFTMIYDHTNTSEETMKTGTITLSNDPAGLGGFTATITDMTMEMTTLNGVKVGLPKQGSMTIAATNGGYSGTNTYTKSGSSYLCDGDIKANGVKVAEVHLTYSESFGNYTGYWIDTVAGDSVHHEIEADVEGR